MSTKAYGTTLGYRTPAGSGTYVPIARVRSIKPGEVSADPIDITTLDSPSEMEEVIAGLGSGGELEFTVEHSGTVTGTIYGLFRLSADFKVTFPGGSNWTYTGFISGFGVEEVVNKEIIRNTIKVKVSGLPVYSAT
jgi:hypothetical protein